MTVSWDKNFTRSIQKGMEAIDQMISKQLSAIMHHAAFQKLEGTWRGLHYLVQNTLTSAQLKLKVLGPYASLAWERVLGRVKQLARLIGREPMVVTG